MEGGEIGAIFHIFWCLEVFGSWLGPGSCYFGGWKGWKLENGSLEGGQCGAKIREEGGCVVARVGFSALGGVPPYKEGGKCRLPRQSDYSTQNSHVLSSLV